MYQWEYTASILDFSVKWFLRKVKDTDTAPILDFSEKWFLRKDADTKLYYINGVWKFNFVKIKSKWLLNWFFTISFIWKKQVDIKIFIHVHFKWVENHHHFKHFSISHQRYTTNFTLDYHDSITQKISHTMRINYPRNPYDKNDSRSWRWWYQKISHTMMIN